MRESLSLQIYQDIYEKIKSRFYCPGEQLPTEQVLKNEYKVSLAPIRQALGKLEIEGLIVRQPGRGTFAAEDIPRESMSTMGGFGIHFIEYARTLTYQTLRCEMIPASASVSAGLGLPLSAPVILISRVRCCKDEPIFLLNHYLINIPLQVCRDAGDISSMRNFLAAQGVTAAYVSEKIKAVLTDAYLSKIFMIAEGYPLLKINRISHDSAYKPLVYEEYYVKSDVWDYQVQFNAKE